VREGAGAKRASQGSVTLEESCKGLGSVTLKNKQSTHTRIVCACCIFEYTQPLLQSKPLWPTAPGECENPCPKGTQTDVTLWLSGGGNQPLNGVTRTGPAAPPYRHLFLLHFLLPYRYSVQRQRQEHPANMDALVQSLQQPAPPSIFATAMRQRSVAAATPLAHSQPHHPDAPAHALHPQRPCLRSIDMYNNDVGKRFMR